MFIEKDTEWDTKKQAIYRLFKSGNIDEKFLEKIIQVIQQLQKGFAVRYKTDILFVGKGQAPNFILFGRDGVTLHWDSLIPRQELRIFFEDKESELFLKDNLEKNYIYLNFDYD